MIPVRRVVPAVLSNDSVKLQKLIQASQRFSRWLQLDIMDGCLVPSTSIGLNDIVNLRLKVGWEAHLMVCRPMEYIDTLVKAGARRIIIHHEAPAEFREVAGRLQALGVEAGLAINPDTPVSAISKQMVLEPGYVLFMSVYPGYYGKPFIPAVLDKVRAFKRLYPHIAAGIDGGIKLENIRDAAEAGADEICVGSAIFAAENPAESYRSLTKMAQSGWAKLEAEN